MWKPIAVAVIALAAIASAGIGSYLAVRHNGTLATATSDTLETTGTTARADVPDAATLEPLLATGLADDSKGVGENTAAEEPEQVRAPAPPASVSQPSTAPPSAPVARRRTDPRLSPPVTSPPITSPAVISEPVETAGPEPTTPARAPHTVPAVDPERVDHPLPQLPPVDGWARADAETPTPSAQAQKTAGAADANGSAPDDRESLTASRIFAGTGRIEPISDPRPALVELQIAADSVIGLRVDAGVSTRTARVEDTIEARVTRDVQVDEVIAVASGTRVLGSVVLSEQGGRLRGASRLGIRFHTLVTDNGVEIPIATETVYREGQPQGKDSVANIGAAAAGGAILGAVFGGRRGAAIGGSIGAAGGTAAVMNDKAKPAGLPPGARVTVRLSRPAVITVQP